ncbi:unnamed protein product, partial [Rotaria socialis]
QYNTRADHIQHDSKGNVNYADYLLHRNTTTTHGIGGGSMVSIESSIMVSEPSMTNTTTVLTRPVTHVYHTIPTGTANNSSSRGGISRGRAQTEFNATVKPKLYGVYDSQRARIKYANTNIEMEGN